MQDWPDREHYTAEDLVQIIRILRDPETGCPWDKVQTHASIRKNFLEETCEALEAIAADDADMGIVRIKHQIARLCVAPCNVGAIAVLCGSSAATPRIVAAVCCVVERPIDEA